ncbi:MAG: hypothetical protein ACJ8J0_26165 [Longimicrobiaceae bacterium]
MSAIRPERSPHECRPEACLGATIGIEWSGAPRATSLRHDAAEAILIGFWAVLDIGWLPEIPPALRR